MLFMNRLKFSCSRLFLRIFKTREEFGFLYNPPVEGTVNGMDQKSFVNLMSKNSISERGALGFAGRSFTAIRFKDSGHKLESSQT
jgi:hypothetical protein